MSLTTQNDALGKPGQAGAFELTPAMIEAGVDEFYRVNDPDAETLESVRHLVEAVIRSALLSHR